VFKITLNRELSTKLIQKNSLPSSAYESQFSDKQKFHSAPKQRRPFRTEVLSNWPFILWLLRITSSAWFTFLSRECSTSWYEIMHLPIIGDFPLLTVIFIHQFWKTLLLTLTYSMVSYCRIFMTLQWRAVFLVKPIMKTRQCMWYLHLRHVRLSPLHVRRQNYWNLLMVETYVPFTLNYVGNVR